MKNKPHLKQRTRIKINIRLSPSLSRTFDDVSLAMGITKNAFFIMASVRTALEVLPLVMSEADAKAHIDRLEEEFASALAEARS